MICWLNMKQPCISWWPYIRGSCSVPILDDHDQRSNRASADLPSGQQYVTDTGGGGGRSLKWTRHSSMQGGGGGGGY